MTFTGKSNFMDAISFVMGERPANLRVKRMGDLVYGANVNKPVSGPACVMAIFELTEEGIQEKRRVLFTRRIRGSGSVYEIDRLVS